MRNYILKNFQTSALQRVCALLLSLTCSTSVALALPKPNLQVELQDGTSALLTITIKGKKDKPVYKKLTLEIGRKTGADADFSILTLLPGPNKKTLFFDQIVASQDNQYRVRLIKRGKASDFVVKTAPKAPAYILIGGKPFSHANDYPLPIGMRECPDGLTTQVIDFVNRQRIAAGLAKVTFGNFLAQAARNHAIFMAQTNNFSHDGSVPRLQETGYPGTYQSQNIARIYTLPGVLVDAWMTSTGHKANILAPEALTSGVGCVVDTTGQFWWTEYFGNK